MNIAINLLPDDLRRRSIRNQVIRAWVPVLLGVSAAGALFTHFRWTQCTELALQAESLHGDAEKVQEQLDSVGLAGGRIEVLQKSVDSLSALRPAVDPLNLLHVVSRACLSCSEVLKISRMDVSNAIETVPEPKPAATPDSSATAAGAAAAATAPERKRGVTTLGLSGVADSDVDVARFITVLRDSGAFRSVQLTSSVATQSTPPQREFAVACVREEAL